MSNSATEQQRRPSPLMSIITSNICGNLLVLKITAPNLICRTPPLQSTSTCIIKSGPHEGSEPGCFYHLFSPSNKQGSGKVSGSSQASHQERRSRQSSPGLCCSVSAPSSLRPRAWVTRALLSWAPALTPFDHDDPVWLKVVTCLHKTAKREPELRGQSHGQNAGLCSNHFRVRAPQTPTCSSWPPKALKHKASTFSRSGCDTLLRAESLQPRLALRL